MLTRAEMIETARRKGLGSTSQLPHTFGNYQKRGLVGHAIAKTHKRGGEGLWHPNQGALWIGLLIQRRHGLRLTTLANIPVGLWLLSEDGVETAQAQRAFGYWLGYTISSGRATPARAGKKDPRSLFPRAMNEAIAEIAHPEATSASKRRLRLLFEEILETHPNITVPRQQLIEAVRDVAFPHRNDADARAHAGAFAEQYFVQTSATKAINVLVLDREDVLQFWEWAGTFVRAHFDAYSARLTQVADDPDLRKFYAPMTLDVFLNKGCSHLHTVLGLGLEMLRSERTPAGINPPPPVKLD